MLGEPALVTASRGLQHRLPSATLPRLPIELFLGGRALMRWPANTALGVVLLAVFSNSLFFWNAVCPLGDFRTRLQVLGSPLQNSR